MNNTEHKAEECVSQYLFRDEPGRAITARGVVEALSRAGLLVTPLHERALAACKGARERVFVEDCGWHPALREVYDVGREALAAEKPKERWTVDTSGTMVKYTVLFDGAYYASFRHEADAYNYANQKNREEAAR